MQYLISLLGLVQLSIGACFVLGLFFDGIGRLNPYVLSASGILWAAAGIYAVVRKITITPTLLKAILFTSGVNVLMIMVVSFQEVITSTSEPAEQGQRATAFISELFVAIPTMLTVMTPLFLLFLIMSESKGQQAKSA